MNIEYEEAVLASEAGLYFGSNAVVDGLADQVGTIREVLVDLAAAIAPTRTLITIQKEFRMETPVPAAETSVIFDPDTLRAEGRKLYQQEGDRNGPEVGVRATC